MATIDPKIDLPVELVNSSRKFRKEALTMAIVALEESTKHLSIRPGIQGEEVVGTVKSGAELRPYRTAKDTTNTSSIESRTLRTYFGDVVEEFDPYTLYETVFGESHTKPRTTLEIVKALCVEMSKSCCENLDESLFSGVRNSKGETTHDLFNGYDTIIKNEITATKISVANSNLQDLGELTIANIGDKLTAFYRATYKAFRKKKKVKLFLSTDLLDMYDDWFVANFNTTIDPDAERRYLHRTNKRVELVALAGMEGAEHLILSTKRNMLVGVDQMSAKEKFSINQPDNPKVVQFFMTMYFGVDFESIDKGEFCCATTTAPAAPAASAAPSPKIPTIAINGSDNINLSATLNATASDSITIKGKNLTAPITVSIVGDGFTVDVAQLTVAQANAPAGKKIKITYAPTDAAHTSATLTIVGETDGINEEIELTGTITE